MKKITVVQKKLMCSLSLFYFDFDNNCVKGTPCTMYFKHLASHGNIQKYRILKKKSSGLDTVMAGF